MKGSESEYYKNNKDENPDYSELTEEKRRLIDLLLDRRKGDLAVQVYHGQDPAKIRVAMKEDGIISDDEVAEAMFDWVAKAVGSGGLI